MVGIVVLPVMNAIILFLWSVSIFAQFDQSGSIDKLMSREYALL